MIKKIYEIYEFKFKDKKKKEELLIYAKEEETALKILELYNLDNCFYFEKPRWGHKKIVRIEIEPSVLEEQQLDTAEQKLIERRMAKGL